MNRLKMLRLVLLAFALISTAFFAFAAIGRSLHPELLSFPILAIALSQLISLWQER
jgi:hypothetical protein